MMKTKINVQDQYLNQSRRERIDVTVQMLSGKELKGVIRSFDNFCVVLETDRPMLIYKHAISSIEPSDRNSKINLFQQRTR